MFKKWYMSFTLATLVYGGTVAMVTLKNGAKENEVVVRETMKHMRALQEECSLYVAELVRKAREQQPEIEMHPNVKQILTKRGFLQQDGRLNLSTKNILLSAAQGTGLFLELGDPVAKSNL